MRTCSNKTFTIFNHNTYDVMNGESYDEYDMLVHIPDMPTDSVGRQVVILAHLAHEICDDIAQHVKIELPVFTGTTGEILCIGLYVFEPERSAMIKLTYS